MQLTHERAQQAEIASHVHRNIIPSAIAASLLIYYGFFSFLEPSGTDLFHRAGWVFYQTLRLGGIAMAAVGLLSLSGHRIALMVDAVVCVAIGALFGLTGVAMLIDGGRTLPNVLNIVFGGAFISAGLRNWRDYFLLVPTVHAARAEATGTPQIGPERRNDEANSAPPSPSLAGELLERGRATAETPDLPTAAATAAPVPTEPQTPPPTPEGTDASSVDDDQPVDAEDVPQGFLSSFADEEPPPRS